MVELQYDLEEENLDFSFYYYLIGLFHLGSIITAMTLTSRIISISLPGLNHPLYVTGGIFIIPVIFFLQDICTEIYGYYNTKKLLIINLFIFIVYVLQLWGISFFLIRNGSEYQNLKIIANTLPRHTISFVLSLAIGGQINNYILIKLNLFFNQKFLALRFISATAVGEAVFQFIAVLISWYGSYSLIDILPLALISYGYKIVFEIIVTPFNIVICRYLKSNYQLSGKYYAV